MSFQNLITDEKELKKYQELFQCFNPKNNNCNFTMYNWMYTTPTRFLNKFETKKECMNLFIVDEKGKLLRFLRGNSGSYTTFYVHNGSEYTMFEFSNICIIVKNEKELADGSEYKRID